MIAVIDYGAGNLASVRKGLEVAAQRVCGAVGELAPAVTVTSDPDVVGQAASVVLPGVGSFGDAAEQLRSRKLERPIAEAFMSDRPFLGICLGLQLLFETSEESPDARGLALVAGSVKRFEGDIKIPHMGWNQIEGPKGHPVLSGVDSGAYAYFVHSYYAAPSDESVVATETEYGVRFCSSVGFGNVFACQFHPEKSQKIGLRILENFVRFTINAAHPRD
ncbi:MAG: imidazole glycerol phosphate synthase subunit HisH [Armatimonadia bacterium]|jgi:glutamine amidotransferase|nr:imidazole glycerol phosphate synthase subunit HisH [Armatimonadia bacterium]